MLFKLINRSKSRETHCGVLEFVAEEGRCYLPYWMMKNLLLNEGDLIQVEYVNLEIARFAKFQPQSTDFLEISNPKAVLENALRNFATLTKGDVISINYNEKNYELCILETRPGNAVSIIECDMDVDFAPPVGYEEPPKQYGRNKPAVPSVPSKPTQNDGYRLDGKAKKAKNPSTSDDSIQNRPTNSKSDAAESKGVPFYDYKVGILRFNRNFPEVDEEKSNTNQVNVPKGHKLKHIGVS
jgi:ubiquitin fusion degradation protein 1